MDWQAKLEEFIPRQWVEQLLADGAQQRIEQAEAAVESAQRQLQECARDLQKVLEAAGSPDLTPADVASSIALRSEFAVEMRFAEQALRMAEQAARYEVLALAQKATKSRVYDLYLMYQMVIEGRK